ncbi:glycosyltransferase [Oceanobacillus sp. FSL K6-0127]|uniref:glycosyltransferase family 2 protein n=1 Tax=Oceanobacillus sp. FSL K6-0127 TaxID=2921420 RepID=UPI0030ED4056
MKQLYMVSIIIPVYNAEKYLENCIESILNQSYKNLEIILVNDGSTDNSGEICDLYAKDNKKIKVIHQHNSGPSVARNKGILAAKGDLIQFVDSDDSLETDMTGTLVESLDKQSQLVICGYNTIEQYNSQFVVLQKIPSIFGVYNKENFLENFGRLFNDGQISSPCNKLYKAQIILKNKLFFMEDMNIGEDLMFNLKYIKEIDSVSLVNKPLYNYLKYNNTFSLTGSYKNKYFETQKFLFSVLKNFLIENNNYKGENSNYLELTFTSRIIGSLNNLLHNNNIYSPKSIKKEIKEIISQDSVRNNLPYFKKGNLQWKIIGVLIKYRLVNSIYWLFKIRNKLKS